MLSTATPQLGVGQTPGMGNPRLVVCDLGGVLIQYSWERATATWAAAASVDAVPAQAAAYDSVWNAFEVDAIERGFFEHLRRRCGHDIDHESLVAGWSHLHRRERRGGCAPGRTPRRGTPPRGGN